MKLQTYRVLFCTLLATLVASSVFATPIVSLLPATGTITAGGALNLTVEITGAVDLFGFQFDVGFDPSVLVGTGPSTEGGFLPTGGTTFFIEGLPDNAAGNTLNTADVLFGPIAGVNGGGTLAFLNFIGANVGTSRTITVSLFNVVLLDSNFSAIPTTVQSATVTVNPGTTAVPEPASVLLLAGGLAVAWRRRRTSTSVAARLQ